MTSNYSKLNYQKHIVNRNESNSKYFFHKALFPTCYRTVKMLLNILKIQPRLLAGSSNGNALLLWCSCWFTVSWLEEVQNFIYILYTHTHFPCWFCQLLNWNKHCIKSVKVLSLSGRIQCFISFLWLWIWAVWNVPKTVAQTGHLQKLHVIKLFLCFQLKIS